MRGRRTGPVSMGVELQRVVDYVKNNSRGLVQIDLARLNLRTRQPLSRSAMSVPDTPENVALAWAVARELVDPTSVRGPTGAR